MRVVGFRNVAVHEYCALNLDVVRAVATRRPGRRGGVLARWMSRAGPSAA